MRGSQYYDNDCLSIEVIGKLYDVNVQAVGTYTCYPETKWDPAFYDFDIDEVEAKWRNGEGDEVEETPEMHDALESYLKNKAEWEQECPYDEVEEREHYY